MKRKICVFTGSRAEYGLLYPLLQQFKKDPHVNLQLLVSGMHLSKDFGSTFQQIQQDGFRIDKKIDILSKSDTGTGMADSIGRGVVKLTPALEKLNPHILVLLGDRFETLAAAIAAMCLRIPIAHLYGGEATIGAMDEAIRHSITKISHLHFTSTEEYRKRVIQLGEDPKRVFNVGALGTENIKSIKLLSKQQLENTLGIKLHKKNFLVTFHPETLTGDVTKKNFQELLCVLSELKDTLIIFTKANADAGGRGINRKIDSYVAAHPSQSITFTSLGQKLYLSTMQFMDAVVGNSSSGIIEAPSFKIGTINIGNRQAGRIRAKSVIDCPSTRTAVRAAIRKLYSPRFQSQLRKVRSPFFQPKTATKIKSVIKGHPLKGILEKHFFDLTA